MSPAQDDSMTAADFNFWCAVNSKPFRLVRHRWPDGSVEWDVEVFPGRPEATVAYGTGQTAESPAAAAAFAFAAGVEWGESFARPIGGWDDGAEAPEDLEPLIPVPPVSRPVAAPPVVTPPPAPAPSAPVPPPPAPVPPPAAIVPPPPAAPVPPPAAPASLEPPAAVAPASPDVAPPPREPRIVTNARPAAVAAFPPTPSRPALPPPESEAGDEYLPPAVTLLQQPPPRSRVDEDEGSLASNARMLETVLRNFKVRGEIMEVRQGPVVTRCD